MTDVCGAETSDGGTCELRAGWGTDHVGEGRCKLHGGAAPRGEDAPNYKHGAFSEYLRESLSERERAAMDAMDDAFDGGPEAALALLQEQAEEAYLRYKRSHDARFLREYRQLVETFNLAPNEDRVALSGDISHSVELDSETAAAIREATLGDE